MGEDLRHHGRAAPPAIVRRWLKDLPSRRCDDTSSNSRRITEAVRTGGSSADSSVTWRLGSRLRSRPGGSGMPLGRRRACGGEPGLQIDAGHQGGLEWRTRPHHPFRYRVIVTVAKGVNDNRDLGRRDRVGVRRRAFVDHRAAQARLVVPVHDELDHRQISGTPSRSSHCGGQPADQRVPPREPGQRRLDPGLAHRLARSV